MGKRSRELMTDMSEEQRIETSKERTAKERGLLLERMMSVVTGRAAIRTPVKKTFVGDNITIVETKVCKCHTCKDKCEAYNEECKGCKKVCDEPITGCMGYTHAKK